MKKSGLDDKEQIVMSFFKGLSKNFLLYLAYSLINYLYVPFFIKSNCGTMQLVWIKNIFLKEIIHGG